VDYFGKLTVDQTVECIVEMLKKNSAQNNNIQVVVNIARKYSDLIGPQKLIEIFESFRSFEGECLMLRQSLPSLTRFQVFTTTWEELSILVLTPKFTSNIFKPPRELV
jgi:hypothetical protein